MTETAIATGLEEKPQDRIALDRSLVSARSLDDDGHMTVANNPISKATVNPYRGSEIPNWQELGLDPDRIYQLLRDPKELEKSAPSFDGKPLLLVHKAIHSGAHDYSIVCGNVSAPYWDEPYLKVKRLTVWTDGAKDLIADGSQRELSAAYRYDPDMAPGTYDGIKYDGVMRNISGSHVALVKEGRAGPDVVVGDQAIHEKENGMAAKPAVLSRKAAVAQGALLAFLRPKLAQDARIDLTTILKDVTAKNFKEKKPAIAADVKKRTEGKLAQDADVDDVVKLLDALEDVIPAEGLPDVDLAATDPNTGVKIAEGDDPDSQVVDSEPDLRAFLKSKGLSDEDIDKACSMQSDAPAQDKSEEEESDEEKAKRLAADKKARDAELRAATKDMVTKPAMDAAIEAAVKANTAAIKRNARETQEAILAVQPHVGVLAMAHDSAEAVYRTALGALDVDVSEVKEMAALKIILAQQPLPGTAAQVKKPASALAQDAATDKAYLDMFPNAGRLKD